ncbi:MAG: DUF6653 family protein [Pseudomonadota bacterium]
MDIFKLSENLMSMDDETWARHANPWSVYSRFTCLPLIVLALWSRVWIGWWSLVPLALALFWTWYNPRAFPPSDKKDGWAFKGTQGERLFLNRRRVPIPNHHQSMAKILTLLSSIGLGILIYGVVVLDPWATLFGLLFAITTKVWFVDRMVWMYDEQQRSI